VLSPEIRPDHLLGEPPHPFPDGEPFGRSLPWQNGRQAIVEDFIGEGALDHVISHRADRRFDDSGDELILNQSFEGALHDRVIRHRERPLRASADPRVSVGRI
jgi:hypothetical protein